MSGGPAAGAGGRPLRAAALLGLAALGGWAYSASLRGPFAYDDWRIVGDDPRVRSLASFAPGRVAAELLGGRRVLTDLTFALNWSLSGAEVLWFHATNVALHLACAALVLVLTRRALAAAGWREGEEPWPALLVAGLFLLHPIQSQAVSYVAQRAEILSAIAYVAVLLALEGAARRTSWRAWSWVGAATIAYVAGFGFKTVVVTAPVAWLAWGWLLEAPSRAGSRTPPGPGLGRRLLLALPLLAAGGGLSLATLKSFGGLADVGFDIPWLSWRGYALTQLRVVATYLRLLVAPYGQSVDWDVPVSRGISDPATLSAAALLLLLLVAFARLQLLARRAPDAPHAPAFRAISFGIFWFLLVLLPTSSVVPLSDLLVEHRLYIASWGIFLAVPSGWEAWRAGRAGSRAPSRLAAILAVGLLLAAATAAHARDRLWSDPVLLWQDAVKKSPGRARGWGALGWAYGEAGRDEESVEAFRKAMALGGPSIEMPRTASGLAAALYKTGRREEGCALVAAALRADATLRHARNMLAVCRLDEGRIDEAEALAREVLADGPDGAAFTTLGEALLARGELPAAERAFRDAALSDGRASAPLYDLAVVLGRLGRVSEACVAWSDYLRVERDPLERRRGAERARESGCSPPDPR